MADRRKMLDRAKALVARSASDSEEEARTSALLACKLMREHGFEVVDPTETPARVAPTATDPFQPYRKRSGPFAGFGLHDDMDFEEFLRHMSNAARPRANDFTEDYREKVEQERRRQADTHRQQAEAMNRQVEREARQRAAREEEVRRQAEHNRVELAKKKKKKAYDNRPCPTNQPSGAGRMYRKKDIGWKAYPADMAGKCVGCGRDFEAGDSIVWAAGFGVFRSQCMQGKLDDFLFVALQPDQVEPGTEPTEPEQRAEPPMFCKAHVWTKLYTSGFNGHCKKCGSKYYKGDAIRWIRGIGSYHPECWNDMDPHEELPVAETDRAIDAVKKEHRNSDWQQLKDRLP